MLQALALLLQLVSIPAGPADSAGRAEASSEAPIHPSHLLVKPKSGTTMAQLAVAHDELGGRVLRNLRQIGWQILEVAPATLLETRERYVATGLFEHVDFDRARQLAYTPNDPMWAGAWNLRDIRADVAWNTQKGSPSVVVAIMDTGIQTNHPDLAANVWVNPGEIAGNGLDDDANGYVDDVNGYDFAYGDSVPNDVNGHGTACAGIVAAVQDNHLGGSGVAPRCKVAAIKAALDTGYFYDSANVPALLYCADEGFRVISMSFFSDQVTPAERDAIDYCWAQGVLPVVAAGNSDAVLPYYPGAYEHSLSVAAIDPADAKSSFSNWGTWVDIAAPGESIPTSTIGSSYTTSFAGTSGAAPHVAGLAGLLFSAAPTATNALVRAAIEDTALSTVQAPYGEYTNYGRIDCAAALQRVIGATSGSKPARFLFASPVAGERTFVPTSGASAGQPITFHGVGFEAPNLVRVLRNGLEIPFLSRTRDEVQFRPGTSKPALLELEVNGLVIGSLDWQPALGRIYVPSDASATGGATASGGFAELVRDDGLLFTSTRQADFKIQAVFAIRGVSAPSVRKMVVDINRAYRHCSGFIEKLEFYDWQSGSFPYGNWVQIGQSPIPDTSFRAWSLPISNNPARFVDYEGTMYARLWVTEAMPQGLMQVDSFRVRVD